MELSIENRKLLLETVNLSKAFKLSRKESLRAVDKVSIQVYEGEKVAIVGESGCGKSTLGRTILQLTSASEGEIRFYCENVPDKYKSQDEHGNAYCELTDLNNKEMRDIRRDLQMIFQDPSSSLNPRLTIGQTVEEAFEIHYKLPKKERKKRTVEMLSYVGLNEEFYDKYPNTLSGGQKQRVGIARALCLKPRLLILDEAVSALDVSVQAQILKLLEDLHMKYKLTYLFITHDLGVVKYFCDRVVLLYLGRVCEISSTADIFSQALHPYTESLISSIPRIQHRDLENTHILEGEVPSPVNMPSGCAFHNRCPKCMDICKTERPELITVEGGRQVACHLY